MEDFKFYEVGGKIRDELLGLTNKDVDYVAVPSEELLRNIEEAQCLVDGIYPNTTNAVFTMLESHLREEGFEIFLVTPDCYTIRAKFPEGYKYQGVAAKAKSLVQDTNLPAAIIVDMDATVCLNTSGRPFYGEGAAEGMLTDEPITPVIELIRNFCDNYPAKLIILTGREDTPEVRKATEQWLENNWLHPDILLMRPAKSFTAGPICKKKLYEDNIKGKFYIPFVLEDNCKCVEMWRNEGLICLQPNEGKF